MLLDGPEVVLGALRRPGINASASFGGIGRQLAGTGRLAVLQFWSDPARVPTSPPATAWSASIGCVVACDPPERPGDTTHAGCTPWRRGSWARPSNGSQATLGCDRFAPAARSERFLCMSSGSRWWEESPCRVGPALLGPSSLRYNLS
jgi:hypothetical protein